jgi:hypothetical protein
MANAAIEVDFVLMNFGPSGARDIQMEIQGLDKLGATATRKIIGGISARWQRTPDAEASSAESFRSTAVVSVVLLPRINQIRMYRVHALHLGLMLPLLTGRTSTAAREGSAAEVHALTGAHTRVQESPFADDSRATSEWLEAR